LRLFSLGGYGLALAALALVVFGAIECPPKNDIKRKTNTKKYLIKSFLKCRDTLASEKSQHSTLHDT